jgi:uncharacterized protein YggE
MKVVLGTVALATVALVAVACAKEVASPIYGNTVTAAASQNVDMAALTEAAKAAGAEAARSLAGVQAAQVSDSGQAGIYVSGQGSITLEPDLAVLSLGVEATGATVAEARNGAAAAMDAVVRALKARGVADKDLQTTSFNIYPQYDYIEVVEDGIRRGKQVLRGYTVSNSASVKIRDLGNIGPIIDDAAEAGGDAVRNNGIGFTVENPKPFEAQLREAATKDALAKAQQYASLAGVSLGKLVYIAELGGASPQVVSQDFAMRAAAPEGFRIETPVSGGTTELTLTVQAVFAIQ